MKKFIWLGAVVLSALSGHAQDKKDNKGLEGAWFATAQVGYTKTTVGNLSGTNTTFLPIVGTFISPSVAIGAGIGYINIKNETSAGTAANTSLYVFQPLVRKYYNVAGGLFFFGQLATPIISGSEKQSELNITQYGVSVSGGFDYFVSKNFSVEFSYNLANLSQTTFSPKSGDKTTVTDFSLAHVATAEPTYNTALGGSNPTLTTPLSFGFKFIF